MTKESLKRLIGDNIRKERTARNMTVDELAELLELTPGFVGLIERGKRGATIHNLYKLSEIFGIEIDKFTATHSMPSLKVSEKNPTKAKRTKITSLIYQMNDNELEFVIAMIKGMKILKNERSNNVPKESEEETEATSYETAELEPAKKRGRKKKNTDNE